MNRNYNNSGYALRNIYNDNNDLVIKIGEKYYFNPIPSHINSNFNKRIYPDIEVYENGVHLGYCHSSDFCSYDEFKLIKLNSILEQ